MSFSKNTENVFVLGWFLSKDVFEPKDVFRPPKDEKKMGTEVPGMAAR
jgi:hypothetical protein